VFDGLYQFLRLLLKKDPSLADPDTNVETNKSPTPLHIAVVNCDARITDLLIKNGADIHKKAIIVSLLINTESA
jgi:ankyrin repeat protein